jgi:hypothetical protein
MSYTGPGEEPTRVVGRPPPPPPPPPEGPDGWGGGGPPDDGGDGRGWMIATVGLIALLLGGIVGYAINNGGNDTKTVSGADRTVTVQNQTTSTVGVTVTQPSRTVQRTVTVPVTVTATVETQPQTTTAP